MNCSSARESRASAPFSTTKRAPDSFAAASKSMRPSAAPISKCSFGLNPSGNFGGSPQRGRTSTLSFSSLPSGTSSNGRLGISASASSSRLFASLALASNSGSTALTPATSARKSAAATSSLRAMARPICFEAALRRSCARSSSRIAARRRSSSAMRVPAAGGRPRLASPASKASGSSRIALMSCMGNHLRSGRAAAKRPVAKDVEGEPRHYQKGAEELNRPQRLGEDDRARGHAHHRHEQREGRHRRGGVVRQEPRPDPEPEHRPGVSDDEHAQDKPPGRMGERQHRPGPVQCERQQRERQWRREARPDGEGEHVDPPRGLREHVPAAPKERGQNDEQEGAKARAGEAVRADHRHAKESDGGADELDAARVLIQKGPRERDGEKRLRHNDERGEPNRKAVADGEEEKAELPEADEEAVHYDGQDRRFRRPHDEDEWDRGE